MDLVLVSVYSVDKGKKVQGNWNELSLHVMSHADNYIYFDNGNVVFFYFFLM